MKVVIQTTFAFVLSSSFFLSFSCQSRNTAKSAENTTPTRKIEQVSVEQTSKAIQNAGFQFIDVRTKEEFADVHAEGAVNHPLDNLEAALASLDKKKPVYVICATGRRSQKASEILERTGFEAVFNVSGGTNAWVSAGLPISR